MPAETEVFSSSYAQARAKFLAAAQAAGLNVSSYPLDLPGRDGEALAVDAAWQGPRNAPKLLLITSGVHWPHLHPDTPEALAASIKLRLFEAFFVDTPEWKQGIVTELRQAAAQALDGLRD